MSARDLTNRQLMSKVKNCALGIGSISAEELRELEKRLGIRDNYIGTKTSKAYMKLANGSTIVYDESSPSLRGNSYDSIHSVGTETGRCSSETPNDSETCD